MSYEVSVIKCGSYDDAELKNAVEASLVPFGGLRAFIKKGDRVLVKLNLLASKEPEKAVTTNPALVMTVVKMVQELGAIPIVGDSPGGRNTGSSYRTLLQKTGIMKVIEETGCEWADLDRETTEISSEKALKFKKFIVSKAPLDADAVICLPKLKTHTFAYYTGAVKLLYGYIPGMTKTEYHLHTGKDPEMFSDLILDLNVMLPPAITIMDAVIGMEGDGPQHGTPRDVGLIISGTSTTAVDHVASYIIGYDPMDVPSVRRASEREIGPAKLADIRIYGEYPSTIRIKDYKLVEAIKFPNIPPFLYNITKGLMASKPIINEKICVKCGKCVSDCPPGAMTIKKGEVPRIDHGACIRCYCCQELCPAGAVAVKKPILRHFLK